MTLKQAIDYLQQVADNTEVARYGAALTVALDAMREVEKLRKELEDERYRHDRQADFTIGQGEKIDQLNQQIDRLKDLVAAYTKAEKEGRIAVLPCKIGDKLWGIRYLSGTHEKRKYIVQEAPVSSMYFAPNMELVVVMKPVGHRGFGKNVFYTREEAERALEEKYGNN